MNDIIEIIMNINCKTGEIKYTIDGIPAVQIYDDIEELIEKIDNLKQK